MGIFDDINGALSDTTDVGSADSNDVSDNNLPEADYSNEGRNYPTTESTQGPGGSPVNASTYTPSFGVNLQKQFDKLLTGAQNNPLGGLAGLLLLGKLLSSGNKATIGGYKGPGINMGLKATREATPQPAYQPYSGAATMGRQFFSPVTYAAQGGIMEAAKGRYLQGPTDGMADKIPSSIDGQQPAKLSHGEFVVPADVVSHLGNGNSDAGANVLYKMMDRVRKARTGTTKQGKQINPNKFTPGGIAGYAGGGAVAFDMGGNVKGFDGTTGSQVGPAVTTQTPGGTTTESNLASWAGPYVTDYLSKAKALSDMPYQPYQGPLSAGYSPLQQQAFSGLANLQMPSQYGMATDIYGQAAQRAGMMSYQPSYFGNQFQAPQQTQATQFNAGFQAPQVGAGTTQFTPQFQAPQQYQAATDLTAGMGPQQYQGTQFQTGLGPVGSVQDYMNQYQQGVTDIAAREARRQAAIAGAGEKAQFAKAGAFGGARQAIAQAERERNLAQQIGDIQQKGLAGAFEAAQKQRLSEAGMGLEAQRALEQSRQYGAGLTQQGLGQLLQARQAQEASRQFGAQQGMQASQLQAQYGLSAQQAQEAARQFNAGQQMTAAQLQSQFGMDAQKANEMARQFQQQQSMQAAQLGAQYGTEAQRMAEQSRQYGADFGLRALQQQMAAAQGLGTIGGQQFGSQLEGLRAILGAGGTQRDIEQQGITALMNEYNKQMMWPYQQLQFQQSMMAGLPVAAQGTTPNISPFQNLKNLFGDIAGIGSSITGKP
jgi:hypothetical protein